MNRLIALTRRGCTAAAAAAVSSLALPTNCAAIKEWNPVDLSKYRLDHHLLHASLSGDGKVEEYRICVSPDRQSVKVELRLGHRVCGHPTIIHGGALAAVFDDSFGALFFASRIGNGFTANLSVDYRRPVPAGTNLVLEAHIDRVEVGKAGSKKVFFKGVLRGLEAGADGAPAPVYTEATALFVVKHVPSSETLHAQMASDSGTPVTAASE